MLFRRFGRGGRNPMDIQSAKARGAVSSAEGRAEPDGLSTQQGSGGAQPDGLSTRRVFEVLFHRFGKGGARWIIQSAGSEVLFHPLGKGATGWTIHPAGVGRGATGWTIQPAGVRGVVPSLWERRNPMDIQLARVRRVVSL